MKALLRAGALALALCAVAPASAQVVTGHTSSENGIGPVAPCAFTDAAGRPVLCSQATPLPVVNGGGDATSTPLTWSVTTATTVGPFVPMKARAIWLTKSTTDTATIVVGATTTGACANAIPLTAANGTYPLGSFSNISIALNENLGSETRSNASWCVTITPATAGVTSSGSLAQ